jgi:hypothetical protein
MMDLKILWEYFKEALIRHEFCGSNGRLSYKHCRKLRDLGARSANMWGDLFTESDGRVWLPVTGDPSGQWRYYNIPGSEVPYSEFDLTKDVLMRSAKTFGIDNELAGYDLYTASELLDDEDMLDI